MTRVLFIDNRAELFFKIFLIDLKIGDSVTDYIKILK